MKRVFAPGYALRSRYIIDLLSGEETLPKTFEPIEWHRELDEFIRSH